jgi:type IV pilus assembly protein PilX
MSAGAARRSEQGVVLFVALIVLVAMSLAGVALMRSVDTGVVIAGNMAFKQSAITVADRGTQEAATWLATNSAGTTLQNTNAGAGYFSNYQSPDPDWFDINSWSDAAVVNGGAPDAAGNVVRYLIHRMCTRGDAPYNASSPTNYCGLYTAMGITAGSSQQVGATQFLGTPQLYYRVTTRVDGPRDTVSVVQTSVLVPIGS